MVYSELFSEKDTKENIIQVKYLFIFVLAIINKSRVLPKCIPVELMLKSV